MVYFNEIQLKPWLKMFEVTANSHLVIESCELNGEVGIESRVRQVSFDFDVTPVT